MSFWAGNRQPDLATLALIMDRRTEQKKRVARVNNNLKKNRFSL